MYSIIGISVESSTPNVDVSANSRSPYYDNDIGIPYILMSKAAGQPLAQYEWPTHAHELPGRNGFVTPARKLTDKEKEKIMHQLGCYARELFSLRFPTIGSLFEGEDGYYIDECLSPGHVLQDRETIEELSRGPFHNEADYYSSLAGALLQHAEQLPMGYHVLRAPVPIPKEYPNFSEYYAATDRWNDFATLEGISESSINRLQYCITSQLLQDTVVPSMARPVGHSGSHFPLCHHDISLQNLFVDNNLNITCIIEANGWKVGQMVSRFMHLANLDALQDIYHLEVLYALSRQLTTLEDDKDDNIIPVILATRTISPDALTLADELAADDEPEGTIRRREKEYFDVVCARRLALARKVALAAKMNPQFVADKRLCRWVGTVLEYHDGAEYNGL